MNSGSVGRKWEVAHLPIFPDFLHFCLFWNLLLLISYNF